MSTAMTLHQVEAPAVTPDQMELVRNTVAKGATPEQLKLFLYDCARQGVHPLDKLIHFTNTGGKYTPITSIDFMRSRASDSGEYAGNDDPQFMEGDDPKYPYSATVTVWRLVAGERCAFTATARWSEYLPQNAFMWKKMPFTMLGKCAEALALRKAFPRQLAGLYSSEEMDQARKAKDAREGDNQWTEEETKQYVENKLKKLREPEPEIDIEAELQRFANIFSLCKTDTDFNGMISQVKDKPDAIKLALMQAAAAKGFKFDRQAKEFVATMPKNHSEDLPPYVQPETKFEREMDAPPEAISAPVSDERQSRPTQTQSGVKVVSEKQVKRLWAIASSHGVSKDNVTELLLQFGVEHADELTKQPYDEICGMLEQYVPQS